MRAALYQRYAFDHFAPGQSVEQDSALEFFLHDLALAIYQAVPQ